MCRFVEVMENFQGDLTDIFRGQLPPADHHQHVSLPPPPHAAAASWRTDPDTASLIDDPCTAVLDASFGDPFSAMSDPLLHHLHPSSPAAFFNIAPPAAPPPVVVEDVSFCCESNTSCSSSSNNTSGGGGVLGPAHQHHYKIFDQVDDSSNCGILSRIQISSSGKAQMGCDSPAMVSPRGGGMKKGVDVMINAKAAGCLTDGAGQVQISSPRNLGIKRRYHDYTYVINS